MTLTLVVTLALLLLAWFALGYWIANLLLYARRQPILRTPADYGLVYEDVAFPSKDHLLLKGWWIPAVDSTQPTAHRPVVILLHPLFGNRHGLTAQHQRWPLLFDPEVDLLKSAKVFHQAGYALLMFDFRSHGESQRGLCGGGLTEDQDVMGAVDYVFQRVAPEAPAETPSVGIVGFGLGAAAALAAVGREKGGTEVIRVFSGDSAGGSGFVTIPPLAVKYLRFVVAVQPTSLTALLRGYFRKRAAFLGWMLIPLVDSLCQLRGGFPLGIASLLKFAREVHIPVLHVPTQCGPWSEPAEAQAIYDALPGPKQIWWFEEASEQLDAYQYTVEHPESMLAFVAQQIGVTGETVDRP